MANFFLKLIAPRPSFATDMNDAERKMMHERFLYWNNDPAIKSGIGFSCEIHPMRAVTRDNAN